MTAVSLIARPQRERRAAARKTVVDTPNVRVTDIGPALAHRWLSANTANRAVSEKTVDAYARDMLAGKWHFAGDPFRIATDGTLLDGQHRLHAIIRSGITIKGVVIEGLDPAVQLVMDTGRKRTFSDHLKIKGEQSWTLAASVTRTLVVWRHGDVVHHNYAPTLGELDEFYTENADAVQAASSAAWHVSQRIPVFPTVIGAAFYKCAGIDHEAASEFFTRLAEGTGLDVGNPIYALRERLIRSRGTDERLTSPEQLYLVIRAWNAWRGGQRLTRMQLPTAGLSNPTFPRPA